MTISDVASVTLFDMKFIEWCTHLTCCAIY